MGVGILLFVVILTWFFVSGTFEAPEFGSVTEIDSYNLNPLVILAIVIVMLLIVTSIGKIPRRNRLCAHKKESRMNARANLIWEKANSEGVVKNETKGQKTH